MGVSQVLSLVLSEGVCPCPVTGPVRSNVPDTVQGWSRGYLLVQIWEVGSWFRSLRSGPRGYPSLGPGMGGSRSCLGAGVGWYPLVQVWEINRGAGAGRYPLVQVWRQGNTPRQDMDIPCTGYGAAGTPHESGGRTFLSNVL